jgi:hypothetical protein
MMNTRIADYLQQFADYTPPETAETPRQANPLRTVDFDNGHIFYGLLEYALRYSPLNREAYTYYYSLSQKLLRTSRQEEYHVSKYFLEKLTTNASQIPVGETVDYHALHSIFNPVIGYYYYFVLRDYQGAEKYMLELLRNIDFMIGHGFEDGMYMKIEQYLNTARVYFNAGRYDDGARYAREVMAYLLSSEKESFEFPFSQTLRSKAQLESVLALFFNGLIFKSLPTPGVDNFFRHPFLIAVFADINVPYNERIDESLANAIDAFRLILQGHEKAALEKILANDVFGKQVPTSVRYFLLHFLLQYDNAYELLPDTLKEQLAVWQQHELRLSATQIRMPEVQPINV